MGLTLATYHCLDAVNPILITVAERSRKAFDPDTDRIIFTWAA